MYLDGDAWVKFFDAFKGEAFRLEVQPTYTMPAESESFARFLQGEPKLPGHNARWHKRLAEYMDQGKSVGRVRVVRRPLTDYQRYQFSWGIPGNIAHGEDIRVLDATDGVPDGLPIDQDWWMFDEERLVHLNYRPDGTQINREVFEGDLQPYREWKRIAIEHALPLADYLKAHGDVLP
ncbi:hypothetical protein HNR23_000126 [Nocardiopsis mwathae]|uniref:DUF6879 domain-containing protein n=1 Tax=Nocardiopsis mwathae TaxID=1472723 RepID=A0A7W9YF07_9ACTN|nr:DUF6879 family protein [Nocardiopsis mwathae]MBB6170066.1 hypothetical protein [Nocardiopsis mwathae]